MGHFGQQEKGRDRGKCTEKVKERASTLCFMEGETSVFVCIEGKAITISVCFLALNVCFIDGASSAAMMANQLVRHGICRREKTRQPIGSRESAADPVVQKTTTTKERLCCSCVPQTWWFGWMHPILVPVLPRQPSRPCMYRYSGAVWCNGILDALAISWVSSS